MSVIRRARDPASAQYNDRRDGVKRAPVRAAILFVFLVLATTSVTRPALADARTEAAASAAMKKAESDYLAMNYGSGAAKLQKAIKACGANKCGAGTRAALERDLGAMLFRKGDKDGAKKAWASAGKLKPGLAMNPAYDSPDVRSAYEAAATGGGGGAAAGGAGAAGAGGGGAAAGDAASVPTNDFTHTPALEQKVNTPLPVYVEGGGDAVTSVVVKYKGATMSDWRRVDLDKVGDGWGGLIPCSDVTSGTMRYYIQGLNQRKEPIANAGDAKHPYTVPIKDEIAGDEPRLPGGKPPKQCSGKAADCPPDFPGCGPKSDSPEGGGEDTGEKAEGEGGDHKDEGEAAPSHGPKRRVWIGFAGTWDFLHLPAGTDLCHLDNNAQPGNSAFYYCTNQNGTDFPSRNDASANYPHGFQNSILQQGQAGNITDQYVAGDLRLMLTFDYALTNNILLGARVGLILFNYPGGSATPLASDSINAAVKDGRASPLGRLHLEARGTFLIGHDPLVKGIAPMIFAGAGAAEFDGKASSVATLIPPATMTNPNPSPITGKVNVWRTGGPGFVMVGGGIRWALASQFGITAGLRLNLAFGGSGLLPTVGPELGAAYGF